MKRKMTLMIAAFAIAALCLTACGHEGGSEEEEGGGGSIHQEYPSSADVIRNAVTDIDGNKYDAVRIGTQVWMASNLRTTRYADGTSIAQGSTSTITPYWYYPNNNASNMSTCGLLYNWKAVMRNSSSSNANPSGVQGICPTGWHVPSDAEWIQLTDYVGRQSDFQCNGNSSSIAKAFASTEGWYTSTVECTVGNNQSSNNATGFSAFPAGYYHDYYDDFGYYAYFWSSTEYDSYCAWGRGLTSYSAGVGRDNVSMDNGFSVRCVRD